MTHNQRRVESQQIHRNTLWHNRTWTDQLRADGSPRLWFCWCARCRPGPPDTAGSRSPGFCPFNLITSDVSVNKQRLESFAFDRSKRLLCDSHSTVSAQLQALWFYSAASLPLWCQFSSLTLHSDRFLLTDFCINFWQIWPYHCSFPFVSVTTR